MEVNPQRRKILLFLTTNMAAMTKRAINLYKIKYTTFPKGESANVFNGTKLPMRGASRQTDI